MISEINILSIKLLKVDTVKYKSSFPKIKRAMENQESIREYDVKNEEESRLAWVKLWETLGNIFTMKIRIS